MVGVIRQVSAAAQRLGGNGLDAVQKHDEREFVLGDLPRA